MDKLQLCDQWDVVSILFPYLQGGEGSAEAHTVQQGILRSLNEAAFYSILADESTDIATIEELSIYFRWVDSSG